MQKRIPIGAELSNKELLILIISGENITKSFDEVLSSIGLVIDLIVDC